MTTPSQMPVWRAMAREDFDFVLDLASRLYPDHPETRAAFAAKLDAAPDACFVATRGQGLVGAALALLSSVAKGAKLSLVAVNGTRALWETYGFKPAAIDETVRATYGPGAVYMERG